MVVPAAIVDFRRTAACLDFARDAWLLIRKRGTQSLRFVTQESLVAASDLEFQQAISALMIRHSRPAAS